MKRINTILTIMVVLFAASFANAQIKQLNTINYGHLLSGYNVALSTVEDDRYAQLTNTSFNWGELFKTKQVNNYLKVAVNHNYTSAVSAYSYNFNFKVTCYNAAGTQYEFYVSVPLSYNPQAYAKFNDASVYKFSNAHKFYTTLLSVTDLVTNTNISFSALKKNFIVEHIIELDRYEKSDYNHIVDPDSITTSVNNGKVVIDWSAGVVNAPTDFELEWLHVDDYGGGYAGFIKDFTINKFDFETTVPTGWYNAIASQWGVSGGVLFFKDDAAINTPQIDVVNGKSYKLVAKIKQVVPSEKNITLYIFNSGVTIASQAFNSTDQYVSLNFTAPSSSISLGIDAGALLNGLYCEIEEISLIETTYEPTVGGNYYRPPYLLNYDLTNNATRVRTNKTKFVIEDVFESGYLLYRIRRVRPDSVHYDVERFSDWNYTSIKGLVSNYPSELKLKINPHENDSINWNYQITYSEQGVKSDEVGYYDGLLKPRQQVTLSNADSAAIVGETKYDFNGRPAIQIVPAPALSIDSNATYTNRLRYFNNFNRNTSNEPYSAYDFDFASDTCSIDSAGALSNTSGASRYYSPANPDKNNHQQYLPDAENYPFVQTEFLPDNTGRIKKQSGIGKSHKIGSGHETSYEYSAPLQEELDWVFGSEVGFHQHYKKQSVRDANGQTSITYTDLSGKVIATALAEFTPNNLDELPSNRPSTLLVSKLNEKNVNDGDVITLTHEATLNKAGPIYIDYRMSNAPFSADCLPLNFCFKCSYVYDLSLVDKACGKTVFKVFDTIAALNPYDTACGYIAQTSIKNLRYQLNQLNPLIDTTFFDTLIRINNLPAGTYSLTKSLRINPAAYEYYQAKYIEKANCIMPFDTFLQRAVNETDFSQCNSCDTCAEADDIGYCDAIYYNLIGDVTPGGQYALYETDPNNGSNFLLIDSNTSVLRTAIYKQIKKYSTDGKVDLINLPNGSVDSVYKADVSTFIKTFKMSWADSLVKFHPEYCYYKFCKDSLTDSYEYDFDKITIDNYDSAFTAGFLNPTSISGLKHNYPTHAVGIDPLFANRTALRNNMNEMLKHYLLSNDTMYDVWEAAAMASVCAVVEDGREKYACVQAIANNRVIDSLFYNKQNRDEYWLAFLGIYNDVKNRIIDSLMATAPARYSNVQITYPAYGVIGNSGDYAHKIRRYNVGNITEINRNQSVQTMLGDVQSKADEVMTSDSSCYHTSIYWIESLKPCPLINDGNYEPIRASLETLCNDAQKYQTGIALYNAAYVPESDTIATFHDIDSVLSYHLGSNYKSMLCNADVIPNTYKPDHSYIESQAKDCKCTNGLTIEPPKVVLQPETPNKFGRSCIKDSMVLTNFGSGLLDFINELIIGNYIERNFNNENFVSYDTKLVNIPGIGNKTRIRSEIKATNFSGNLASKNRTDWRINFLDSVNNADRCNIFFNLKSSANHRGILLDGGSKTFTKIIPLTERKFVVVLQYNTNDTVHIIGESGCKDVFNLTCVAYNYDTVYGTPFMADSSKLDSFIQRINGIRNGTADSLVGKFIGIDDCSTSASFSNGSGTCKIEKSDHPEKLIDVLSEMLYSGRENGTINTLTPSGSTYWGWNLDDLGVFNFTMDDHSPTYIDVFGLDWSRYNGYRGFAFNPNNDLNGDCFDDNNIFGDPEFIGLSQFGIALPGEYGGGDFVNCSVSFGNPYKTDVEFSEIDSFTNYRFDTILGAWVVDAIVFSSPNNLKYTLRVRTCRDKALCGVWARHDTAGVDKKYRYNANAGKEVISFSCNELNRFYDENHDLTCPDGASSSITELQTFPPFIIQDLLNTKASNNDLTQTTTTTYSIASLPSALSLLSGGEYQAQHVSDSLLIAYVGDVEGNGCHLSLRFLSSKNNRLFNFDEIDGFSRIRPDVEMITQLAAKGEFNRSKHYFIIQANDVDSNKTFTLRGWLSCQEVFSCVQVDNNIPKSTPENCGCLTCPEFKEALSEFDSIYPFATVGHELYEKMLTNFLNRELDNNLTYTEYMQFKETCRIQYVKQQPATLESDLAFNLTFNTNCLSYIDGLVQRILERTGYNLRYQKTKDTVYATTRVIFELSEIADPIRFDLIKLLKDSISASPCSTYLSGTETFNPSLCGIKVSFNVPVGQTQACVNTFANQFDSVIVSRFGINLSAPSYLYTYNPFNNASNNPNQLLTEYCIDVSTLSGKNRKLMSLVVDSLVQYCAYGTLKLGFEGIGDGYIINQNVSLLKYDSTYLAAQTANNVSCANVYDAILSYHDSVYKYRPSYIREATQLSSVKNHLYNWYGYKVALTQTNNQNGSFYNLCSPTPTGQQLVNVLAQLAREGKLLATNVNISRYTHLLPNVYISSGTDSTYYTGTSQYINRDTVWLTLNINKNGTHYTFKVLTDTFGLHIDRVFGMQGGVGNYTLGLQTGTLGMRVLYYGYATTQTQTALVNCCTFPVPVLCFKPVTTEITESFSCYDQLMAQAEALAISSYKQYTDSIKLAFNNSYKTYCNTMAVLNEKIAIGTLFAQYHYTLYYYDVAGNLVKTVPPAGVDTLLLNSATRYLIDSNRRHYNSQTHVFTNHKLATTYKYNSLGQIVTQNTPDAGSSSFYYDRLGRLVLSQNSAQKARGHVYSYTIRDALNRTVEVGEITGPPLNADSLKYQFSLYFNQWLNRGVKAQITRTYYDNVLSETVNNLFVGGQQNLRNRVATAAYFEYNTTQYNHATHYSYDIHGNVKVLVHDVPELNELYSRYKYVYYHYDLISGKVNMVRYQPGSADRFYHKYVYDNDNRLVQTLTSTDSLIWDNDAAYTYYKHGPLARTELGHLNVQGIDYAYTAQGWLKGVNANTLDSLRDMGRDGHATLNPSFAPDVFGFSLGYFNNDYKPINTAMHQSATAFIADITGSPLAQTQNNLYNGNISHMVTAVKPLMQNNAPMATLYRYDQLNRITQMQTYQSLNIATNQWQTGSAQANYLSAFAYDANGNITKLYRAGNTQPMDSLHYFYFAGTNRLNHVTDNVSASNFTDDIENQTTGNYAYDNIGNLIKDEAEEIDTIQWNVYGKIRHISRTQNSTKPNLEFRYDAMGQRAVKIVKNGDNETDWQKQYYVRDAQGNILATYQSSTGISNSSTNISTITNWILTHKADSGLLQLLLANIQSNNTFKGLLADHLNQNNLAYTVLNQYPLAIILGWDYSLGYQTALSLEGSEYENDVISQLEQFNQAQLWAAMVNCLEDAITQLFTADNNIALQTLINLCGSHRVHIEQIAHEMGITSPETLSDADLAQALVDVQDFAQLNEQLRSKIDVNEIISNTDLTGGCLSNLLNNGYTYGQFMQALGCYEQGDLQTFFASIFDNPTMAKDYLINSSQQAHLINLASSYNFSTYLQHVIQQNLTNSINFAISNMQTQSVIHYLTWISQRWGTTAYNSVAGSLQYNNQISLSNWHLYGSSRLGIKQEDAILYSREITINGFDTLGNVLVNDVLDSVQLQIDTANYQHALATKQYELTNHLGNVLATVLDRKTMSSDKVLAYQTSFTGTLDGWTAGWSEAGTLYNATPPSTVSLDNNRLKGTATVSMGGVRKVITTNIGTAYTLTLNIDMGTAEGLYIMPRTTNGGNIYTGTNLAQVYVTSSGTHTVTFTASTSTTQLLVEKAGTVTQTFYIDNVKVEQSTPTLTSYPIADVVSAQHYYPFGSTMQTWEADGKEYTWSFNGKMDDSEVEGQQDYGMRIYDKRLARFKSVDPIANEYPELSTYQFAGNTPIQAIDLDGLEPAYVKGDGFITTERDGQFSGQRISAEALKQYNTLSPKQEHRVGGLSSGATDFFLALTPFDEIEAIRSGTDAYGNKTDYFLAGVNILMTGGRRPSSTPKLVPIRVPNGVTPKAVVIPSVKKTSGPKPIEVSSGLSTKNAINAVRLGTKDFVFDPIMQKAAIAPNRYKLGHTGLKNAIGSNDNDVVGGRIRFTSNGDLEFSEWSGHYGHKWTPEIKSDFEAFMKDQTGIKTLGTGSLNFSDGKIR